MLYLGRIKFEDFFLDNSRQFIKITLSFNDDVIFGLIGLTVMKLPGVKAKDNKNTIAQGKARLTRPRENPLADQYKKAIASNMS